MTGGNTLIVQGLPFTSSFSDSGNQSSIFGIGAVVADRITFSDYVVSLIQHGNAHFHFRDNDVNIADSSVNVSDVNVSGGSDLLVTFSYPSA